MASIQYEGILQQVRPCIEKMVMELTRKQPTDVVCKINII
jgi:hypothetical protein